MIQNTLNSRPETAEFMRIALSLPKEQQLFITEVLTTMCNDKGISLAKAWDGICTEYNIPTIQELDKIFQ